MDNCIFCKIVARELPAEIVFEDERTLAFLDIRPINKGHTLVIPKQHYDNIFDIDEETVSAIYRSARKVARAVKKAVDAGGVNIHNNNGEVSGQEVFHYHAHIIPRFKSDNLTVWPHQEYEEGEISEYKDKISKEI